ncbi:DgyrCDS11066 [Dimorphilus gyrociliatus]|uniref:DgyrCDS11066 n=1 Tax=Dimorphilus gyrociliatus TaxID=2664684 RepID=A0A7I8W262_9ANNE|nr:DgyrCDS11066 [Dimorphilus gyrociliatus]
MSLFPESLFEKTCLELENPVINEYELFTDSLGVKIFRRYIRESGLYEYKIYGNLDVQPEYTFIRELQEIVQLDKKYWVVIAKAEVFENYPEKDGVVRVKEYEQQAVLTSDESGGTKAFMKYYDNPGGSLPSWLINWAAKARVPEFLTIMQKSCREYKAYLDKKDKN